MAFSRGRKILEMALKKQKAKQADKGINTEKNNAAKSGTAGECVVDNVAFLGQEPEIDSNKVVAEYFELQPPIVAPVTIQQTITSSDDGELSNADKVFALMQPLKLEELEETGFVEVNHIWSDADVVEVQPVIDLNEMVVEIIEPGAGVVNVDFIRHGSVSSNNNNTINDTDLITVPAADTEHISEPEDNTDDDPDFTPATNVVTDDQAVDEHNRKKRKITPKEISVQPGCRQDCEKQCGRKIPDDHRKRICEEYAHLQYNEKRAMVFLHVSRDAKRKNTVGDNESRRKSSFTYRLKDIEGVLQEVCKTFFLTTLGYHAKNDRIVSTVMATTLCTALTVAKDRRGSNPKVNKISRDPIKAHIESFNPTVSHYRREHAPNRRYIPSDITIRFMFNDFKVENPEIKCSYETYRKTVDDMKISFVKLGEEECEKCEAFNQHLKENPSHDPKTGNRPNIILPQDPDDCDFCETVKEHKARAALARGKYRDDAEKQWPNDWSVRSADLQKIIMLPRMPGFKTAIFTKRIIAYHETFATVGKREATHPKKDSISAVWHEGVAGRNAEEIASAFAAALQAERDSTHIIYWLDNCTAKNKNWCLLTTLVALLNSETVNAQDITLKYFEPGHTFMSADSFHHGVELEMKKRPGGKVFDFPDFVDVVQSSNSRKVTVIELGPDNVLQFQSGISQHKRKKVDDVTLAQMSIIQIRRGSRNLFFKVSHENDQFRELDFIKKNFKLQAKPPVLHMNDRGISAEKKHDIIQKLCPLMPQNRREFWQNMPVSQ